MELRGQIAIVTGAGRMGADIVVAELDTPGAERTAGSCASSTTTTYKRRSTPAVGPWSVTPTSPVRSLTRSRARAQDRPGWSWR
jgi:hypothetical protein